jgi:outer membrane biosynthesis protein TonB
MQSTTYVAIIICCLVCATISAPPSQAHFSEVAGSQPRWNQPQSSTPSNVHTFMGKILNQNDVRFILRDDATDAWYHLDDQAKAEQFFGKDVVITGTYDGLSGTIRIQTIRERTANDQIPAPIEPVPNQESEPAKNSAPPARTPENAASAPRQGNPAQPPVAAVPQRDVNNTSAAIPAPRSPVHTPAAVKESSEFLLNLPEEAVGATSSVAIVSRRSVVLPSEFRHHTWQDENDLVVGKPLRCMIPSYPVDARQQGVEGTVKVHAVIGVDGAVQNVEPVSGPPLLVAAAVSAIRGWRFGLTKLDGRPIEAREDITLFFRLSD